MIRALLLLSVVAGCTETIQVAPDRLSGLTSIEIAPGDATITITDLWDPLESTCRHASLSIL